MQAFALVLIRGVMVYHYFAAEHAGAFRVSLLNAVVGKLEMT